MYPAMIPLLLGSALSVELPIYVGVEIPPRALERALAEADRLFDAGGIRFQWRLSPDEPLSSARATCSVQSVTLRAPMWVWPRR